MKGGRRQAREGPQRSISFSAMIWFMLRAGSAQPASPTMRAGTPATVLLLGTGRQHDRARRHPRAMADLDIAEHFGAGADQHAAADFRMAVADLLAGAAERHALQDRHVVLDDRRLADHQAGGMVEEDALADPRRRIDVDVENRRGAALQIEREIPPPRPQQGMGEAIASAARENP